jgi:hypothetical protein
MRMDNVALAKINSFASQATRADSVSPSEESIFILTAGQLQTIISQAIQPMKDEITALRQKVARLEELEEIYHGPGPQPEDIPLLRECWIKRREILNDLPSRVWGLEEDLATLEQRPSTSPAPIASPKGAKTIARIAKIEEVLKTRGPSTLKELERILGIDKATMTRLLARLDMRRYELHSRPGDDREKVLRLKVQIR